MYRLIVSFGVVVLLLALGGCAGSVYVVEVSAFKKDAREEQKHYVLLPASAKALDSRGEMNVGDLQFQAFSRTMDKVLFDQGYRKASDLDHADVVIFMHYAVGPPEKSTNTYSVPVWSNTQVPVPHTVMVPAGPHKAPKYVQTTMYTPLYRITGYTQRTEVSIHFMRTLELEAYAVAPYRQHQALDLRWGVTVKSRGVSDDLSVVMPYMMQATKDYIAQETVDKVVLKIPVDDPEVKALRGEPRQKE